MAVHLVFALADGFKQALLGAVKRETPREEDEEDNAAAPHVHRFTVRLSLHHLWGHEMGSPYATWSYKSGNSDEIKILNLE